MLFNSYIFMFAFLPLVWLVHAAMRRLLPAGANGVLALASLGFYAWWDVRFLPLILLSIAGNFILGRRIIGARARTEMAAARGWMVLGIVANLSLLGFFKYADFFLGTLAFVSGQPITPLGILLPIGISFFTFQQIAYLIDVHQGRSDRYGLIDYTLFVSFFPQLIAGPIVHHREMMPQFVASHGDRSRDVALGLTVFIAGLFKKVILADNLAAFATPVFAAADLGGPVTSLEAWGGALAYTFQLYFDFSGYSDMAIGLGLMFGIRLPINFNSPYKATSIIDFWRRWHMTLSQFLRDYLYIPLGGNRKGPARRYVNLFATMLLGGLWHGAGWGFVFWGGLHGIYLALNHMLHHSIPTPRNAAARKALSMAGWLTTFLAVVFAWVFFRATTFNGALEIVQAMLGIGGFSLPADFAAHLGSLPTRIGLSYAHASVLGLKDWALTGVPFIGMAGLAALILPNSAQIFLAGNARYRQLYANLPAPPRLRLLSWTPHPAMAGMAAACFALALIYASTISEFLYFQF